MLTDSQRLFEENYRSYLAVMQIISEEMRQRLESARKSKARRHAFRIRRALLTRDPVIRPHTRAA
jgi:hypothetical protein